MHSVNLGEVLAKLTLEEKASLLAGANFWETVPIDSKGVPKVKVSDGPNGARGDSFAGGITAACFPAASCMASTFDVSLAKRVGTAIAEETKTKGARCLLGPTMCLHRHPLGGRNFESFSEDPYLTGKMAARVVEGLQGQGIAATIKHFAINEQETERMTVNETVGIRALRELYLKPFEMAVKEANPWAVMTAYNMVNGNHCDSNEYLLKEVLRGDWGWDGLVMSDWGGVNSTAEALNAGLDLEMPGPTIWRKVEDVVAAVQAGKVTEATINERAMRVLQFLARLKCFEDPTIPDERAVNKPEHQALIREAGAKGMVLLKNEGDVLPLSKERVQGKRIALLGHAKSALAHGGGSASVNAHYKVTPWDAMHTALGDSVEFTYAKGADTLRNLPPITDNVVGLDGKKGFSRKLYEPGSSEPVEVKHGLASADVDILNSFDFINKDVSLEGTFTPAVTDDYYFALSGIGPSTLLIDGKVIAEQKTNCPDPMGYLFGGAPGENHKVSLEAGQQYKIFVRTAPPTAGDAAAIGILAGHVGVRCGHMTVTEHDKDYVAEAIEVAKAADVAVIFTGHEAFWETEGQDQQSFNLPKDGSQDELVAAVAAVNPNTIVVNSTGVAVAMPWVDKVQAVIQAWFSGQECGNSIADVLTGALNPEGHLTCTFPKKLEDCPAHGNFPGEVVNGRLEVKYEEGVFVGYRHFDRLPADKVQFPFGFGLSYTTFDYSDLTVGRAGDDFTVHVKVTNTGKLAGAVAVQVYVGQAQAPKEDPLKVLAAFEKVTLQPGQAESVALPVSSRDIAFFDETANQWVVRGGNYKFMVAKSSQDVVLEAPVAIAQKTYAP
ncbi:family 3 glycoside hydrolase [Stachybotrys elegans]|uniref:beta-glucosidase n=1 Tax=Stachybotrys elegans TaxID=80388 RepID=A0A8K0T3J1_9HYPO|nr:family 3 glycoside hydrolase [Stachybotrys elegans]